jgi:hypothetical protein
MSWLERWRSTALFNGGQRLFLRFVLHYPLRTRTALL